MQIIVALSSFFEPKENDVKVEEAHEFRVNHVIQEMRPSRWAGCVDYAPRDHVAYTDRTWPGSTMNPERGHPDHMGGACVRGLSEIAASKR